MGQTEVTEVDARKALKDFVAQFSTHGDAASALAVSKQFLSQMLNKKADVTPRVLAKLGLKRAVVQK